MGKARRAANLGGGKSPAEHERNQWAKRQLLGGLSFGGGASRMSGVRPRLPGLARVSALVRQRNMS
jgi:hypothetical protein